MKFPFKLGKILDLPIHVYWKDTTSMYLGCNDYMAQNLLLKRSEDIMGIRDRDTIILDESSKFYAEQDKIIVSTLQPRAFIDHGIYKSRSLHRVKLTLSSPFCFVL